MVAAIVTSPLGVGRILPLTRTAAVKSPGWTVSVARLAARACSGVKTISSASCSCWAVSASWSCPSSECWLWSHEASMNTVADSNANSFMYISLNIIIESCAAQGDLSPWLQGHSCLDAMEDAVQGRKAGMRSPSYPAQMSRAAHDLLVRIEERRKEGVYEGDAMISSYRRGTWYRCLRNRRHGSGLRTGVPYRMIYIIW